MGTITVTNLGKAYKQYPTRWSRLAEWLIPLSKPRHSLKWVMQDVSFTVKPGEAVGIIGINGAGKSTLLKMITGTTQPTTGSVHLDGRVAALLELGMGFHPDFTGRQNAYMAGQLLGYSSEEIGRLMPEIEAFADIGDYIDRPVRIYSSGMQVRLAFSVATAVRPDILIVDEALAVGDIFFQQKCMQRIFAFREAGTTLLLVTHDFSSLSSVCDRALLVNDGRLALDGVCSAVVEKYFEILSAKKGRAVEGESPVQVVSSTHANTFEHFSKYIGEVYIGGAARVNGFLVSEELAELRVALSGLAGVVDPHVGFRIQDSRGNIVFETNSYCQNPALLSPSIDKNKFALRVVFWVNFAPGEYTLAVGLESEGYGSGLFKSVVLPTKVVGSFVVTESEARPQWAGGVNIYPTFEFIGGESDYS